MITKQPDTVLIGPLALRRDNSDAVIDVNEGFSKLFLRNSHIRTTDIPTSSSPSTPESPKQQNNNKKSQFFCRSVTKAETIHRSDYTEEEKKNYWMTAVDLIHIRQTNDHTVRMFREGLVPQGDTDSYCSRGLEHRISDLGRKQRRSTARRVVLNHQKYSSKDPEVIAEAYRAAAASSILRAYNKGVLDEIEAKVGGMIVKPPRTLKSEQQQQQATKLSNHNNKGATKNKSTRKRTTFGKIYSLFRTNVDQLARS